MPTQPSETITFNESEGKDGFVIRNESKSITVHGSKSSQKIASSKVKVTNVVDYTWDTQHGNGRLMHPHCSGKYIAYSVKVHGNGAVRVVDLNTNDRILMRGNHGLIRDLEFMHKLDEMCLGFIDELGSFYIYRVKMPTGTEKMSSQLVLQVNLDSAPVRLDGRRFIWCKYVPDETATSSPTVDFAYHFAVCQDNVVYVGNVNQIADKYGEGIHLLSSIKPALMMIDAHSDMVVDASFAPDGTALATASKDGSVKFFQVYLLGNETPRCLYTWNPHDGAPVSRIFFLDDHSLDSTSTQGQYWKYMITAGPNFSELKLWTCQSWTCIQTINFCTPMQSARMEVNSNSKFMVLSDFQRKIMYIMNVEEDSTRGAGSGASFKWMSEFSLPVGMLGFHISNAEIVSHKKLVDRGYEHYVSDESDADACIVDMILVQPKSLMEASVTFHPPTNYAESNGRSSSRITFDDSVSFKGDDEDEDELSSSMNQIQAKSSSSNGTASTHAITPTRIPTLSPRHSLSSKSPGFQERDHSKSPGTIGTGIHIMSHPARRSTSPGGGVNHLSQQLSSLIGIGKQHVSPGGVNPRDSPSMLSNASSSPSREVEEILSPRNSDHPVYIVNNLDVEGNIIEPEPRSFAEVTKSKARRSLGGGEIEPHLAPSQILDQFNSLVEMMKAQQRELKELKREISRINATTKNNVGGGTANTQISEVLLNRVTANMDAISQTSLNRVEQTIKKSMEAFAVDKNKLPANFTESMAVALSLTVQKEMENRVLPQILRVFDPIEQHLADEVNKIMRNLDNTVSQQMKEFLTSPEFKGCWIPEFNTAIRVACENSVSAVFTGTVVPAFERSLASIFQQVNESFMKGTREYLTNFENASATDRAAFEGLFKKELNSMQDSLSSTFQVELESQLQNFSSSIHGALVHKMESVLGRLTVRVDLDK